MHTENILVDTHFWPLCKYMGELSIHKELMSYCTDIADKHDYAQDRNVRKSLEQVSVKIMYGLELLFNHIVVIASNSFLFPPFLPVISLHCEINFPGLVQCDRPELRHTSMCIYNSYYQIFLI